MRFGQDQMNEIVEKIRKGELRHQDCIIVGDNSSGKSLLLKTFIENEKVREKIYFIDAVNRGFDVTKVSEKGEEPNYRDSILETRLDEMHFNLVDSFNCFGTSTERVEIVYWLYDKALQNLFFEFTGDSFRILEGDPLGEVDFGNGIGLLSSGYQAIVRILLELLYYESVKISDSIKDQAWVVVDELDEFLSPKYSAKILGFLKQKFPWAIWLVTTHSCDLVASAQNANLILLDNGNYEVIDVDDYNSISEVQVVFERLYGRSFASENNYENTLRRLLNNRINNAWSDYDERCLEELSTEQLTASQRLILKQIQEW
ncbi:MAG: hypothetical protein LUE92_01245 [Clostridiales bacterium]|nr:hypothetical protein [Clostridiales bacterium]